jgi:hypothetical protein
MHALPISRGQGGAFFIRCADSWQRALASGSVSPPPPSAERGYPLAKGSNNTHTHTQLEDSYRGRQLVGQHACSNSNKKVSPYKRASAAARFLVGIFQGSIHYKAARTSRILMFVESVILGNYWHRLLYGCSTTSNTIRSQQLLRRSTPPPVAAPCSTPPCQPALEGKIVLA